MQRTLQSGEEVWKNNNKKSFLKHLQLQILEHLEFPLISLLTNGSSVTILIEFYLKTADAFKYSLLLELCSDSVPYRTQQAVSFSN